MKKKTLLLTLILILILSLVGCNESTTSNDVSTLTNTAKPEESTDNSDKTVKTETLTDTSIDSSDSLEIVVNKEIENTLAYLSKNYDDLKTEFDTYNKYKNNTEKVYNFYSDVLITHQKLTIKLREYGISYTEMILTSDIPTEDKYEEMEALYDIIYDDAGDDLYDKIYDGILDDMYDRFYDGILDDAYDTATYSEWSDLRSNEYDIWSNTRSDIYDDWADFRSDIYDFGSDIRSEILDDDIEKATKKLEDFQEDVIKLNESLHNESTPTKDNNTADSSNTSEDRTANLPSDNVSLEIRPEFQAAMDSYEAFFDEYVDFMNEYISADTNEMLDMMETYTNYMAQYAETMERLNEIEPENLNEKEHLYYLEVSSHISAKLLKIEY